MASNFLLISVVVVAICAGAAFGSVCTNPKVNVKSFSTEDARILTEFLAYVGEFTLKCENNAKPNLFAEFPCGKIVPVAQIGENQYQISWTSDIKKGSSGDVVVRLLDEEGYANARKAQRDGDKVSKVKSLVDITIPTKGAYKGPWIKAELLAALVMGGIAYFALSSKSKLQA